MMNVWKRILRSRKIHTAVAGLLAAVFALWSEADYTEEILGLITVVTGALVGGQAYIDGNSRNGAPSDRLE